MSPSVSRSRFLVFATIATRRIILARRRARKKRKGSLTFSRCLPQMLSENSIGLFSNVFRRCFMIASRSSQKNPWVARDKTSNMKFFFSIVELGLIYPPDPLEYADRSPKEEIERTLDLSSPNRDTFFAFDILSDFFLLVHFSERARLHKE